MFPSTSQLLTRCLARGMTLPGIKFIVQPCLALNHVQDIHITSNVTKEFRIGKIKTRPDKTEKVTSLEGEETANISSMLQTPSLFPDAKTQYLLFDGVPYNKLHIINVKATPNNTIMTLTNDQGLVIMLYSAGVEGFKNAKKGTNVAAQQAATTFSRRILEKGLTTMRLRVQGVGPGRMGAIKAFQLSGLNIVSITDDTRVSWNPPRPRKQRRI